MARRGPAEELAGPPRKIRAGAGAVRAASSFDREYVAQFERNLEYARRFLLDVLEDPSILDSIPDGATIVPYPVAAARGRSKTTMRGRG